MDEVKVHRHSGRYGLALTRSHTPFCSGVTGFALLVAVHTATAQIRFEDVSSAAGMTGYTESWGASWGDLNGDNWPDLFVQGHRDFPRFYRNTGDGAFEDVAYEVDPGNWIAKPFDDKHGASWGDFDNDGDEDLLIAVSVTGSAQLLVNEGGELRDRAADADVSSDSSARQAVWFDYTGDGYLDVAQLYLNGAKLRRQDPGQGLDFDDDTGAGFSCNGDLNYGQMLDINGDGALEFICAEEGVFPYRVFDVSRRPFLDVTSYIPSAGLVNDTVVADFNGDLRYDIFMTRGSLRPSGATLASDHRIESWLRRSTLSTLEKGFSFVSPGEITVTVDHTGMGQYEQSKVATLGPDTINPVLVGVVWVNYSPDDDRWHVTLYNDYTLQAYVAIETVAAASDLVVNGLDNPEFPTQPMYLENGASGMRFTYGTGLYEPMSCVSAVAGDFDNDMDIDLYLVCRNGAENIANRLFENQGNGTFVRVMDHGAEGPLGADLTIGVGESVVTADYDVDGLLDLFVTNGLLYYPIGKGGPDKLYRNRSGNSNHWMEIDLQGTDSNRDGVGAKVYVTAGGVTQLREQNGGYHRWSQNHQRLHFGLAANTTADVRVEWPSGRVDTFIGLGADRLYDATEGGSMTPAVLGDPVHTQLRSGDECGEPPYHLDYGPAVLLWRDCPSGDWHLRAKGGRATERVLRTAGRIVGDAALGAFTAYDLNSGDQLVTAAPDVLEFSVGAWYSNDKGFDFNTGAQNHACLSLTTLDAGVLIIGNSRKKPSASFDLVTLGACSPPPPPTQAECGDPLYDRRTEPGLFAWRDCAHSGAGARWNIRASGGGLPWAGYIGRVTSDVALSATGFSLEANDTLDSLPGDPAIDFNLLVGGTGEDGFQIDVPDGSHTCLDVTVLPADAKIRIGSGRQPMTGPFDLLTLEDCDSAPPPAAIVECGEPRYDRATEAGVFVWRNCAAGGATQEWQVRVSGGGGAWFGYTGVVSGDVVLDATGVGLEASDIFDTVAGDGTVDFTLYVGGNGEDGFRLDVAEGANPCFVMTALPPGAQVQLGAGRQVMSNPFSLSTLEVCN